MFKSKDVNLSEYFSLPNSGLMSYFDRVVKGNSDEYRTKFYPGKSLKQILNMWKPNVEKLSTQWPTLLEFENDLAKKVGPLSIQKPLSERIDDIESYYESILKDSEPISASAIAAVNREWARVSSLELRSAEKTVEIMKKSTNSGNPFFVKKRTVVDKTVPLSIESEGSNIIQHLPFDDWKSAAVLGWRGQEGGPTDDDVKQRVVWMFPFGVNIEELRFYQVAIECAQKFNLNPAWVSMDEVDKRMTHLFDTKGSKDLIVCTDFTKFDQHFNPNMQKAAYEIIAHQLSKSANSKYWLKEIFPIKYNIPLICDERRIYTGPHGMGSGAGGTNYDESMAHRALQYEAAQKAGSKLNPNSQCLGDDGCLSYPGISVEDVTSSYTAHGLDMNVSKQYASEHTAIYLRRWHNINYREGDVCVGVYSTYRALGRLCEQERFYDPEVWGPKMVSLRQLSILENCKYHPLREQFVQFCMKGDKFRLGLDIPGFLDNIEREAKKAMDLMPDFLGYTKSLEKESKGYGIASWWVVNYLRSLK